MSDNNDLVIYRNDLNLVSFKEFDSVEMDIYFAVCSQLKESHTTTAEIDLNKLRQATGQQEQNYDRFIKKVLKTNVKMSQLLSIRDSGNIIEGFSLFPEFSINKTDNILRVQIHPKFSYILNNVKSEFTRYELKEFTNISSRYTKTLFRQLKQYRDTGMYIVNMTTFRQVFDIPDSYRQSDIDRQILKPSIKELSRIFEGLKVEKIKKGRSVSRLKFTFKKQDNQETDIKKLPTIPMFDWLNGGDGSW